MHPCEDAEGVGKLDRDPTGWFNRASPLCECAKDRLCGCWQVLLVDLMFFFVRCCAWREVGERE